MSAPTVYESAQAALEIEALRNRAEKAEDLAAYWQAQAEHLKRIVHAVELLDCSAVSIENSGSEGLPWEISVCAIVEGGPQRWQNRRQYVGSTLLEALERLAKKEVAS